ncbi:MAG: serine hydrolase [Iphinoe sp. HA4291-MV1]|jgi:D-alanyl-D-alanine carboxypeptidase|nr:serine hydrolase [Iphinoe sp. HA4291-MV1]
MSNSYFFSSDLNFISRSGTPDLTDNSNQVLRGSAQANYLDGKDGSDKLFGLAGNDVLNGFRGDDQLNGGTGKDLLIGGWGNDVLIDNDGADFMFGGKGADQFLLDSWDFPDSPSIIADFEIGTDKVKIGRLGAIFNNLNIQNLDTSNAVISDQGHTVAIILGVEASRLKPDDFIFGDPELAKQLQNALDNSVNASGVPGATAAVITPDGFTWKGASGLSNLDTQQRMQPDDIFSVGSISKTFTSATVLRVVEQGKVSLDDTLSKWLPDIAKNIPDSENTTLREILNGSAGIYSFVDSPQYLLDTLTDYLSGGGRDWQLTDLVTYSYGQPRFSGPASSSFWTYPDTGNILAALIVEKATGLPFAEVLREQVTEPLGLSSTSFRNKNQILPNQSCSYEDAFKADGSLGSDGILDNVSEVNLSGIAGPAGGIYSNAQDVARFSQALFSGELLQDDSLQQLVTFVDEGIPYEGEEFGLGIANYGDSFGETWGKSGQVPGYSSQMFYFPQNNGAITTSFVNFNDVISSLSSSTQADISPVTPIINAVTNTLFD